MLGRTIVTTYGTKRGAIALGRAPPFGIGAAIGGGGGNLMLAKATGRYALSFFEERYVLSFFEDSPTAGPGAPGVPG